MPKRNKIDATMKDLNRRLSRDKSLVKELSQLSEVMENLSETEDSAPSHRWPYSGATPILEATWRQDC